MDLLTQIDNANIKYIDKSSYANFEWKNEPDYLKWNSEGFNCLIYRDIQGGFLCIAVGVNEYHPLYNFKPSLNIEEDDYLPYIGDKLNISRCSEAYKGLDYYWYFEFKFNNFLDIKPCEIKTEEDLKKQNSLSRTYKNIYYALDNIKDLLESLKEYNR